MAQDCTAPYRYVQSSRASAPGRSRPPNSSSTDRRGAGAGDPNEIAFSHFFLAYCSRGALDENSEQIDDGTYTLIDDHTRGLEDLRVTFVIEGDTLSLTAVIPPEPCDEDCRDTYAYLVSAYYPGEFTRTG